MLTGMYLCVYVCIYNFIVILYTCNMYAVDHVYTYTYIRTYVTGLWGNVLYLHPICNFEEA